MGERSHATASDMKRSGLVQLKGADMFSVWVKTACSNHTSKQLRMLADIVDEYAKGYVLFTTRQIPIIPFVNLKDVEHVQESLAEVNLELDRCGATVRNINVCYAQAFCSDAVADPIVLAERLDNFFRIPMQHKVKIGVAGCRKDCVVSRVLSDLGFVAVKRDGTVGYDCFVGGRLGVKPVIGIKMAESLSENECEAFTRNAFEFIKREGKQGERIADIINRLGEETVKQRLTTGLLRGPWFTSSTCSTIVKEEAQDTAILEIRATCGEVTSDQLRTIAHIAEKHGVGLVHFVVRGSPEIPGVDRACLDDIRTELDEVGMQLLDSGLDNLQSCFGNYCTESNVDPQSLLRRIEDALKDLEAGDLKIRISASGCPNSCGISQLNDIGFYGVVDPEVNRASCDGCALCIPVCKRSAIRLSNGVAIIDKNECRYCGQCVAACPYDAITERRKGFAVLVGGSTGEDTRLGEVVAAFLTEDEAFQIATRCVSILINRKANAAAIIDEIGRDRFKEMLLSGSD